VCYDFGEVNMKGWKRLFYYLMINVMVTTCTVLAVLAILEKTHTGGFTLTPIIEAIKSTSRVSETAQLSFATSTPTPQPTLDVPAATATLSDTQSRVLITNVFGAGDLETERVQLGREGNGDLDLEGWQLRDEDGNVYQFPRLTLGSGGGVDVYTKAGRDGAFAVYWGLEQAVWSDGETVTLVDRAGNIQATFQVP